MHTLNSNFNYTFVNQVKYTATLITLLFMLTDAKTVFK